MVKEIIIWSIGLVLVCLVTYGLTQQKQLGTRYEKIQKTELEIERMKEEILSLEKQVAAARDQVKNLENDPTEIEAVIRTERQLTRPGETVFIIEKESVTEQKKQPQALENTDDSLSPLPAQ